MFDKIMAVFDWTLKADYRTWVAHALMAALIAVVFGGEAAIVFYLLREAEQIALEAHGAEPITSKHWLDHAMDFVGAVVGVFLIVGAGWARPF